MTETTETTPAPQAGDYAPKKDRAASLLATRKAKMDEFFKGKKFTIAKEVHLDADKDPFVTPFGNKGRHGYVLVEVDNAANKFIIGETMLRQVAADYDAVEMPVKARKRRTKEQKAADDAAAAAAKGAPQDDAESAE